jgi:bifunctional DNase/RNase
MYVRMELSRVIITETSPQQVIFLKESDGERTFPIMIGVSEALAIDRRWKDTEMLRPMTHDLLASVIGAMGGRVQKILINDLREHTFYATLVLERNGETLEIDSRPSDAIALGVAFDTPIFVADHVLDEVMKDALDLSAKREILQLHRGRLASQIVEIQRRLEDAGLMGQATGKQAEELRSRQREMQAELEAIDQLLREIS